MKRIKTLKKNYEFKYVLSKGDFYCEKLLTGYIKSNTKNENVIGIAVSSKYGKAVKRNKVKRLIRANYQLIKPELIEGYNIVFLLNKSAANYDVDFYGIKEDMEKIFRKAGLIKGKK